MSREEAARVVFDCNIFLQGAANRLSPARACLRLFFTDALTLYVSDAVLNEVRDVLYRPVLRARLPQLSDRIVEALIQKIEGQAVLMRNVPEVFHYERDPKDEKYLNLAIQARATYLVSRDKDILDLMTRNDKESKSFREQFPQIKTLAPVGFLREIEQALTSSPPKDRDRGLEP